MVNETVTVKIVQQTSTLERKIYMKEIIIQNLILARYRPMPHSQ